MTKTQKSVGGLKKSILYLTQSGNLIFLKARGKRSFFTATRACSTRNQQTMRENTRRNSRSLASNSGLTGVTNVKTMQC